MTTSILFKLLLKSFGIGVIAYGLICLALRTWQNRLVFFPSPSLDYNPNTLGLTYQDVWIPILTRSGKVEKIHGWWLANEDTKDVLLYLHGNGGNISTNLGRVQRFHQMGFSVLIIDYRGYGLSDGKFPTEVEVYRDAQAAWNYLLQKRAIKPENIIIYGHSLGGAIAIDLAVRQPLAAGVIVESSFTSMKEIADTQGIYRFLPLSLLLTQQFDSLSKLKILQVPLLLIHGVEDRSVPARMSQILFAQASVPKELLLVPYAGHNNVASVGDQEYIQAINNFRKLTKNHRQQLIGR